MSLGKHTIANIAGATIPMLAAVITIPLYIDAIGAERYGTLAVIMAMLSYFTFFDLGFGRAVAQKVSQLSNGSNEERGSVVWTALITTFYLGLFGSLLLWISADFILNHFIQISTQGRQEATTSIYWLLLALPILLPMSVLIGALQARLKYMQLNLIQALGGIAIFIIPLLVARLGYVELAYLVPATLIVRLLTTILLAYQCCQYVPIKFPLLFDKHYFKQMINYGGWVSVMSILAPLLVTVDRVVIASTLGAKSVANYSVPYDMVSRLMVISGGFSGALFPRLATDEMHERHTLEKALRALMAIMTPIVILGLIFAQPLLGLWMGTQFSVASKWIAELILLGVWVNAIVIPYQASFLAKNNPKQMVMILILELPIYFGLLGFCVVKFGLAGAALAWFLRVVMDTFLLMYLFKAIYVFRLLWFPIVLLASEVLIFISDIDFKLKLIFTVILVAFSITKDYKILLNMFNHLRR